MKTITRAILFLALACGLIAEPVTQIGNGNVSGTLYFGGATTGGNVTGTSGALSLTALGSNQNITLTPSGTGIAQVSFNPGANPTGIGVNGLHVVGADSGGFSTIALDAFGSVPFFVGRRANGTAASPTAIQSGDFLFQMSARGYGTSYTGTRAYVAAQASENWTGSANGTRITFLTTGNGSTSGNTPLSIEPDQSIRIPSTNTSGLQLYNTADQTTNYERLSLLWSSNQARVAVQNSGTGVARGLGLLTNGNAFAIAAASDTTGSFLFDCPSTATAGQINMRLRGTSTATSGTNVGLSITPTYNQASGTASNTDLLVNRTQTAVGSGAQLLADFQVGGVSQFRVGNTGSVVAEGSIRVGGSGVLNWPAGTAIYGGAADGVLTLRNAANTDFGRLQFGGTTSSFPALKRSTTTLQVRLADDSADATITAAGATLSGALITTPQALSGAGAANLTTTTTFLTTTGGADAITLANASTEGQIKIIVHKVDGGGAVLTPTTGLGFTTVTFTNVGETVTLQWTSAGWVILSIRGAVAA